MRLLNGSDLASYIKERQAAQVRGLRQAHGINPKLAIVVTIDNPVTNVYLRLKERYGADILVSVDVHRVFQSEVKELLNKLSKDDKVHAIIVQLPLEDVTATEEVVNLVLPEKDVDGLSIDPKFDPATPLAILWLLSGYNIDLVNKSVLLVGRGKLVGAPLEKMLLAQGVTPEVADKQTADLKAETLKADVIITATGVHGLIRPDMLKHQAVVIDAGVASEGGKTVGDVAPEVYQERDDLTITPLKGGVGPLTVCALFDNVIRAAQRVVEQQT
ncbi:MAG TPA: bifunctional 5,10-methylenetetrahydrofolate dehydrogenase/5,10-methenyltetrahydrofolate cyclohydrolase [Methylomirabilota bacterium]|nr:bifunctional 5,10-methylenetetrahydrofolate dehydrogenase/5,10-methenyltetrahydrofolate cyclohydrolase [Methylomirabilota bacterium]